MISQAPTSQQATEHSPRMLARIDLPLFHARMLSIMTSVTWTPEVATAFDPLLETREFFISGTPYSHCKKKHIIAQQIHRSDNDPPEAHFGLLYRVVDSVTVPVEDRKEDQFLSHVLKLNNTFEFLCNAEFEFPEVGEQ